MTEVVSVTQKPLTLTEELKLLRSEIPTTVGAMNELETKFAQLLNKVLFLWIQQVIYF